MIHFYYLVLFFLLPFNCQSKKFKSKNVIKLNEMLNNIYFDHENEIFKSNDMQHLDSLKLMQYNKLFNLDNIIQHAPTSDQLIRKQGYPCEIHDIITEDGYILRVFRIPFGRKSDQLKPKRPPLILYHGIMCSSDCWILNDPSKALGFRLADEGYDVWITNSRGTTYSMNHTTLSISDPKYWNFSVHELATKDLPATIDYILNITGYEKLTYVGHSQGTTIFFMLTSTLPQYNEKILVMSAFAPVVYLDDTKGLPRMLMQISSAIKFISDHLGIYHVLHHSLFIDILNHLFCRPNSIFLPVCEYIFFIIVGMDSPQLNKTLVEVIGDYSPSGAGVKQILHFSQFTNGRFARYDYGPDGNLDEYNSISPPAYNLTRVTAPVVLHYSTNDYISRPIDVQKLYWIFPNLIGLFRVPYKLFNHIDFMWANDVNKLLYNQAIYIIKQFL